jgi:hypothetical protein
MKADETFAAKTGRSNAQPKTMRILTRKRPDGPDGLGGQNVALQRKLPRRREERRMRRDVNDGVDWRLKPKLAVKRRRMPSAVLPDVPRVRRKMLNVKLLRPKKPNAPKGVAPGRPRNVKLMLNLDHRIVGGLTWTLTMMMSAAGDVRSDVQHVREAMPRERAVASLPRLSTTTFLLKVQFTGIGRRIRRARRRRLVGHTPGPIHGFKTIQMLRHRPRIYLLSTTRLLRTERGPAEESHADIRNMTM